MKSFAILLSLFFGSLFFFQSNTVFAQFDPLSQTCDGVTDSAVCNERITDPDAEDPLTGENGTLNRVANLIALVSGAIAVIIIIVAGITMSLSGGDSTKVQNSRNAIIYAAIGIVVIAVARGIVALVVNLV